ncbi:MAG: sensor histidine kinase [Bacteroidota bacterium]
MKSIKTYVIIILACYKVSFPLYANEQIDTLLKQYSQAQYDTNKINLFNALSKEYQNIGKYDTALYYGEAALKLAKLLNFQEKIGDAYKEISLTYYKQGNYDKALENQNASLKIMEAISNKYGISASYNNIGLIYFSQGLYEKALQFFFASLKIREKIGDNRGIANTCLNVGLIYYHQGIYNKALENYFTSLKIMIELGDKRGVANAYNNIGLVYYYQKKYNEALEKYSTALKIKIELGDKHSIANTYNNIGMVYFDQNKYNKALENHFASLKIREDIGDKYDIAASFGNIGDVYKNKLNYSEAIVWFQKALSLAKEVGGEDLIETSCQGLWELSEETSNYKKAFEYYQLYSQTKNSIFQKRNNKDIAELQVKYETEKKEKEIRLLNNENKIKVLEIAQQQNQLFKNKILSFALFAGIILIIVISWLLISRNRIRQKEILKTELLKQQGLRTNAIIETQEMERKRIAQDLHDGIGHKLTILKFNFEKLIGDFHTISPEQKVVFEQTENLLDETHKEVRTLSHSMMPKALQERELADAVSDLVDQTFANSKIKYSLKNDLPAGLPENIQVCIYRVLQELLNNILKYSQATEVAIQILKNKNTLILFVEDNGIAIQKGSLDNGIGLQNIAGRIDTLKGLFTIEPGPVKGTVATIRIPLPHS